MPVEANAVRGAIADFLADVGVGFAGRSPALGDEVDLLFDGLIDSLGLLSLLEFLRIRFGETIDFEDLDPEDSTIVGPLCHYVARRATEASH